MWLVFSTFTINVIFACFSKLCPLVEKCWSTVMESSFLESDRWLLIRRLDAVSLLPMSGLKLHREHSIRYMTLLDLQLR